MARKIAAIILLSMFPFANTVAAQELEKLSIVVFGAPSLGAFLPPVIRELKLDEKNGLSIDFQERTPDAYTAQVNSGEFKLGGSAALLTVGLADIRGVKVTYLFNLFDFWGALVTSRSGINTVKDLEGKDIAAAKGTTNYVMFDWFARRLGVDTSKFSVVNTATPGLVGYALADRASAIQLWEPAHTVVRAKKDTIQLLDLQIAASWEKATGSRNIPYLGVAAHTDWVAQHKALIPKLYAAYKEAGVWIRANPEDAAKLISPKGNDEDRKAISELIRANDRLGMNIRTAAEVRKEIRFVYDAGKSIAFLPSDPSDATIYDGPMQ
jgi:NitT/TauT family transport system substrate-binding protein